MIEKYTSKEQAICVVGLGYVGLPVALEFARKYKVVGFDINQNRVEMMQQGSIPAMSLKHRNLRAAISISPQNQKTLKIAHFMSLPYLHQSMSTKTLIYFHCSVHVKL